MSKAQNLALVSIALNAVDKNINEINGTDTCVIKTDDKNQFIIFTQPVLINGKNYVVTVAEVIKSVHGFDELLFEKNDKLGA